MRPMVLSCLSLVVCAATAMAQGAPQPAAQPAPAVAPAAPAPALRVGIVDVVRLIDEYDRTKDLEAEMEGRYGDEQKKMKVMQEQNEALRLEMKTAGEKRREEIGQKLQELEIRLKVSKDTVEKSLMITHRKYTQDVYNDIKEAVAMYGKEKGYDLILKRSTFDKDKSGDQQMQVEMMSNMVLFNRETMDLTEEVLGMMNARYRQTGGAKGAGTKEAKEKAP